MRRPRQAGQLAGPSLRRTAAPTRYPAGRRAGGSSAHTPTVRTRGYRRQPDSAWLGSGSCERGYRPLTHTALDELPDSKTLRHLRSVLVATGALPARDEHLAQLERWIR